MMDKAHGIIRDYADVAAVINRVRELRKLSCAEVDRLAGWPDGLASKALTGVPPIRNLGSLTLRGGLGAVGIMLIAVDDPEAMAKYVARATQRDERQVRDRSGLRLTKKPTWLWSRRKAREMRRKQITQLSPRELRRIARKGWKTRRANRKAAQRLKCAKADQATAPAVISITCT